MEKVLIGYFTLPVFEVEKFDFEKIRESDIGLYLNKKRDDYPFVRLPELESKEGVLSPDSFIEFNSYVKNDSEAKRTNSDSPMAVNKELKKRVDEIVKTATIEELLALKNGGLL
jgi:hypothetical protein